MPIRAHNFVTPSSAYQQAMQLFLTIRARAVAFEAQFSGGGAADQVKSCYADFAGFVTQLNTLRAVPGIAAYAKSVGGEDDLLYEVVPEFDELITRVTAVVNGIASVFPVDAQGWWAMERPTSPGSQSFTTRAFTGGQLAALRTALNNVSAHIVLS